MSSAKILKNIWIIVNEYVVSYDGYTDKYELNYNFAVQHITYIIGDYAYNTIFIDDFVLI